MLHYARVTALQYVRVTAFTVSELLGENQHGSKITPYLHPLTQIRFFFFFFFDVGNKFVSMKIGGIQSSTPSRLWRDWKIFKCWLFLVLLWKRLHVSFLSWIKHLIEFSIQGGSHPSHVIISFGIKLYIYCTDCHTNMINICFLKMPNVVLISRWINFFEIPTCQHYLMMTILM